MIGAIRSWPPAAFPTGSSSMPAAPSRSVRSSPCASRAGRRLRFHAARRDGTVRRRDPCDAETMRILVAEDDPGLRDVIVLGLADSGYHVDAVDRGDDAIDQLKFYDYDVAIIDWRRPGAEGIDVVAWARRPRRPAATLTLTARDTPD